MGELRQELAGAITLLERQTAPSIPTTIAGIVGLFGGTRATAEALGVTQRTVQRWAKAERGEGGQTRRPNIKHQQVIAEKAARRGVGNEILKRGIKAHAVGEVIVSPEGKHETTDERDLTEDIPPDDASLREMVDAMERGDWETAEAAFTEAFMDAYSMGPAAMFGDVDLRLSLN